MCFYSIHAERLPVKTYTVADGLAHSRVQQIFQDAKGFLWLATGEGLSRFDGYVFTNYGKADGLGHDFVNDVAADRQGRLWAATNGGGVSLLIDQPEAGAATDQSSRRKKFVSFPIAASGENNEANWVNRILFDADNRLWCVTDAGLFRARNLEVAAGDFELIAAGIQPSINNAAFSDSRGRLWFGVNERVIAAGGETKTFEFAADVLQIIETKDGRILAETHEAVYEFIENANKWREIPVRRGENQNFQTMLQDGNGDLWIGTHKGLIRYRDGRQTLYTDQNGLNGNDILALTVDRENNLWIGSETGLNKLTSASIVSYTTADGLPSPNAYRITADRAGNIYAQTGCSPSKLVKIGEHAADVMPNSETLGDCRTNQLFQDSLGRWWFNTKRGLEISFSSKLDLTSGQVLTYPDGKPIDGYMAIYEDAEGKIWFSGRAGDLYAADATHGEKPRFGLIARNAPAEFVMRDSAGILWLADRASLRRMRNGIVKEIKQVEGLAAIQPRCLFQDSRGRVWIGTRSDGAIYTDEPQAEYPNFKRFTAAAGLTSETVWTIAEDDAGAIYFGTGRGIDRLDRTGKMRRLTTDDGVVGSVINHLFKDRKGNIWAASNEGISRINPAGLRENLQPPPVFITRILVAGEELPIAETGVSSFAAPDLTANQNNVAIRFVGLSFQGEHALRYEYRLEGVDADWTRADEQREVNYANLAVRNYRFAVRAVNAAGITSENPATFEFQIPPPVWQRWWFAAAAILLAAWAIYAFYRYRVNKLLEIERTRTRIATDLHDDIGTNLSKISLMSEIVNLQLAGENTKNRQMLSSIAEISRESVASMSDIVWAINPDHDSTGELISRMREHAEEIFVERGVQVRFDAPADGDGFKLSMNPRRELFLIFKEAIANAAKYSDCQLIEIDFYVEDGTIFLQIGDDGRGFDVSQKCDGNGLENMKRRAENNRGNLTIESKIGGGTKIKIEFPQS